MLLCCALLAAGCNASYPPPELAAVGQGRPGWIDGHEDPRFLPPRYVAGVGLAKATKDVTADRKLADQNAFAEVAQQISVDVHARLSLQQLQVSTHKTNAFRDETRSDVTLASTITLNGLEIRERYSDPKGKIHYSLAVLDRVVAAESHHHALERHRKNYQAHLATFQKHRDNGEGYQALTSLREAFAEAGQYEDRLPAYQLLRGPLPPSGEVLFEPPSCAEVLDLLSDMLPRVRLDKIAGDNQQIIVGQPIPSPFIVRASLDGPTRLPMAGFPVVFRMTTGLGELSPTTSRTDEEGRAWSSVLDIMDTPDEEFVLETAIDLSDLRSWGSARADDWNRRLEVGRREVRFRIARKKASGSVKTLVTIHARPSHLPTSTMRSIISDHLAKAGFSPIAASAALPVTAQIDIPASQLGALRNERVTFLVVGNVHGSPCHRVQGMIACSVTGSIRALSTHNGSVIASRSFQDVSGFGMSSEQALDNALKKAAAAVAEPLCIALLERL